MGRFLGFLYGIVAYLVFFATFLYAIGFVAGVGVPKTIDTGTAVPLTAALIIDVAADVDVCHPAQRDGAPAVQALVDARSCRRSIERSTYVLLASLALASAVLAVAADSGRDLAGHQSERRHGADRCWRWSAG